MKEKSRAMILLSWIHDILLFEGIYVLAIAIWNIRGQEVIVFLLNGLFMIFPVSLSYIIIYKCRSLWIFLAFSLIMVWGMHTLSGNMITTWLTVFVFLFRFYVKMKQGEIRRKMKEMPNEAGAQEDQEMWEVPTLLDAPRVLYCLFPAGMYLYLLTFGRHGLLYLMLGILASEFCVCLAYCYLESLEGFVKKNIRVANLPAGAMKKIGNAILLTGITALMLFMLPAAIYHKEPLADIRLKPLNMEGQMEDLYQGNTEPDYLMEELLRLKSQAKKTPEWLLMASDLLYIITLIGLIFVVIKLIIIAIRKAMDSFSEDGDGDDEIIFLGKDDNSMTEKRSLWKPGKKEGFRSPERKIRRLYKKLIRRSLKETPYGCETPLELEQKAGLYRAPKQTDAVRYRRANPGQDDADICRIHELYEKARYSKDTCTQDDARLCGQILSDFKFSRNHQS